MAAGTRKLLSSISSRVQIIYMLLELHMARGSLDDENFPLFEREAILNCARKIAPQLSRAVPTIVFAGERNEGRSPPLIYCVRLHCTTTGGPEILPLANKVCERHKQWIRSLPFSFI